MSQLHREGVNIFNRFQPPPLKCSSTSRVPNGSNLPPKRPRESDVDRISYLEDTLKKLLEDVKSNKNSFNNSYENFKATANNFTATEQRLLDLESQMLSTDEKMRKFAEWMVQAQITYESDRSHKKAKVQVFQDLSMEDDVKVMKDRIHLLEEEIRRLKDLLLSKRIEEGLPETIVAMGSVMIEEMESEPVVTESFMIEEPAPEELEPEFVIEELPEREEQLVIPLPRKSSKGNELIKAMVEQVQAKKGLEKHETMKDIEKIVFGEISKFIEQTFANCAKGSKVISLPYIDTLDILEIHTSKLNLNRTGVVKWLENHFDIKKKKRQLVIRRP